MSARLMLSYQNLEEVTLLLTSHTEMWDVHEVHVKYQRKTSIDPGCLDEMKGGGW